MGGACPIPFTLSTITYKAVEYAPVERADTLSLFLLYLYMYSVVDTVQSTEAEFLDEIQTKVFRVFLHLYSFGMRFIFFQIHATSNIFIQLLLNCKEQRRNTLKKAMPLPNVLRNPYRKPRV